MKPAFKPKKILWIDLEMTGLDPHQDQILEVATIATDWEFQELGTFEAVVHHSNQVLDNMNDWSKVQHKKSGLTKSVEQATDDSSAVEQKLIAWTRQNFDDESLVLLAGNSVHMDRRFIETHWQEFDQLLHYRMLDVSAWKVVFEAKYKRRYTKPEAHRALEDIRGSIEELRYYLKKVKS